MNLTKIKNFQKLYHMHFHLEKIQKKKSIYNKKFTKFAYFT